ncbi:MAG: type II toxin-antitoxin system RelE/ParE family toxin [Proteobacteria bacterium]|nr:type II toxin-antitoxin system RelE/ParE family toxin [Pseudomonadota bacterium]
MRLRFTPLAEQDLESIADYFALDSPRRALSFVRELRQQCERIALTPQAYRLRPELAEGIRSCAYGNYVIFFEATAGAVLVVRILHGARDLPAQFPSDDGTH